MFERSVRMLKNIFAAYVNYVLYVAYSSNLFEKFHILETKYIIYFLIYDEYPTVPHRPLSSTHRFQITTILFQHSKFLSSTPKTPQFNTKIPQFHLPISSTPKTSQFNTSLSSTHPSVPYRLYTAIFCLRDVLN